MLFRVNRFLKIFLILFIAAIYFSFPHLLIMRREDDHMGYIILCKPFSGFFLII